MKKGSTRLPGARGDRVDHLRRKRHKMVGGQQYGTFPARKEISLVSNPEGEKKKKKKPVLEDDAGGGGAER